MKTTFTFFLITILCLACNVNKEKTKEISSLEGTWQLLSATIVERGDTTFTDFAGNPNLSMIKIINATHFSFLNHDLKKDSTRSFVAGGGTYMLAGDNYTEHLEYCSARDWEGHTFEFNVQIKNDTLIQQGIEKIEDAGIERHNQEVYVRVKQ